VVNLKNDLLQIRMAALEAVNPALAVRRFLHCDGMRVYLNEKNWALGEMTRVFIVAVGKASVPMAEAAVEILGQHLSAGIVVTKYEHAIGHALPTSVNVFETGHPVPDAQGIVASQAVVKLLDMTTARDLVVLLISGGASALLPFPVTGLTLHDLQITTDLLLRAGVDIGELNTVRKHLSRLKGGQLARLLSPAPAIALILSDVVGDRLDVIASGLTVPDPTTYADATTVLARYALLDRVPPSVRDHLDVGCAGDGAETPKPGDPVFAHITNVIIGSNRIAAQAAVAEAKKLGYRALLLSTFVEGEAREVAKVVAALAKGVRRHNDPLPPPLCLVLGGETTVTVRGRGKGGRNQELALAVALALDGLPGVALLALATDGTDGPTDAAGAIVDGQTLNRARALGWDAVAALNDNNAYPLLAATGDLLRTGPTGTNVNDLIVLLIA